MVPPLEKYTMLVAFFFLPGRAPLLLIARHSTGVTFPKRDVQSREQLHLLGVALLCSC